MMKSLLCANLILWVVINLAGCKDCPSGSSPDQQSPEPNVSDANTTEPAMSDLQDGPDADTFAIVGTVVRKSFEGGFFAIDGDDGRKYDPIGLPEDFQKNGLKVKVMARLRADAMSLHMYGAIIEIVDIVAR